MDNFDEQLDLLVHEKQRSGLISLAVPISLVLHGLLIFWFVRGYDPIRQAPQDAPIARYVELIQQNPGTTREFNEAPGPAIDRAPAHAPLSDKNRRASMPQPTGDLATNRPGEGGAYIPPTRGGDGRRPGPPPSPAAAPQVAQDASRPGDQQQQPQQQQPSASSWVQPTEPPRATAASATGGVDWRSAIQEVGRSQASKGGGGQGFDLGDAGSGGEKGFAEQGPLSFETQWYDWGDYAASMVSQIRYHWYSNMPQIIRTGMKGVVTIRFTIQRSGQITNIEMLQSSGIPPYDHAAKKALELASPLKPLPKDFPNPSERVTAMFYYNTPIPGR